MSDEKPLAGQSSLTNPYTIGDVGCYVDSARGCYAIDGILNFVRSHGADLEHNCPSDNDCGFDGKSLSTCEFSNEYEDEADDYMNTEFPVDGATWGRSEQGDWGLWAIADDV